ncbi:piggyBac transposable element-derived protein 4-like [Acanthaster planci]|uniref:PiggyBac transposable element-derived protein 4-like n=1 Tax=Acanthaster planci TaxID=133434 RepID=A0A8B7YFC3_ACAPL|nr:piggyBac transposable element-derived protein 4-like [Acanthaster planci]
MAKRKGMPKDLQSVKLKQGETAFRSADLGFSGSLPAMVWRDKRNIRMLSTMHTADIRGSCKQDRTGQEKQKPTCVIEYNTLMGGVDKSDQLAANHPATHKSLKWYKKLLFSLLNLTLVNSYAVYLAIGHHLSFLDRLSLVRELLFDEPLPEYRPQHDTPPVNNSGFVGRHFPVDFERTSYGDFRHRRCVLCTSRGLRKKTHFEFECDTCHQPLCVAPCFKEYRTVH